MRSRTDTGVPTRVRAGCARDGAERTVGTESEEGIHR